MSSACAKTRINHEDLGDYQRIVKPLEHEQVAMIVYGEVVSVGRVDIDKSGRNPKYQVSVVLKPSKVEGGDAGLQNTDVLVFKCREHEVLEQLTRLPEAGEKLGVESRVSSNSPGIFPIIKIWFQEG